MGLLVVVVVMLLAGSFSHFAASMTQSSIQANDRKRAFYLAEAGISEAYAGLLIGKSGNVGTIEEPAVFGDGLFWVEASEVSGDLVEIISKAMVASGEAELAVFAERGEQSIAALGVFADTSLVLYPGTFVDSYDSSAGDYGAAGQVHTNGVIGSNSVVQVTGSEQLPTTVLGDVTPGPNHVVEILGSDVTITGSTKTAGDTADFPPISAPEVEFVAGRTHSSATPLVVPPGTWGIESFTVAPNAEVRLQGPATLVFGDLTLNPESIMTFDTTEGAIDIYCVSGLDMQEGSLVELSSTDPSLVSIQVPGETTTPVNLGASTQFHGVVYAPATQVAVGAGFELFGALIGKELLLDPGTTLHFDEHLTELASELRLPRQVSWQVLELSSSSDGVFSDPFDRLGVDKNALPPPADAHKDQWLEITYFSVADVRTEYAGWESGFDWNDVLCVVSGTRDGEPLVIPGRTDSGNLKDPTAAESNPDPALAAIADPELGSSDVRDQLMANLPLSNDTLIAAIDRDPALNSSHLGEVLDASGPLANRVLAAAIHNAPLSDSDLADVLVANSPLGVDVYASLLARDPPLAADKLLQVQLAQ